MHCSLFEKNSCPKASPPRPKNSQYEAPLQVTSLFGDVYFLSLLTKLEMTAPCCSYILQQFLHVHRVVLLTLMVVLTTFLKSLVIATSTFCKKVLINPKNNGPNI